MEFSQCKRLDESRRVMGDKRNSRKRKGNVFSSCATPAYMNGLETMALTQKQQEKVQVCEKQTGKNNRGNRKWMK